MPIQIEDLDDAPQLCLLDSGATSNRFPAWLADAAGLSLGDALDEDEIVVGGARTTGRLLPVELTLGDVRFQAPAWFCDPWNLSFCLLGQEGFFRFFRVTFSAAEGWLECEPEEGAIALISRAPRRRPFWADRLQVGEWRGRLALPHIANVPRLRLTDCVSSAGVRRL